MDRRIDDFIAEVTIRSDDSQEIKSIELLARSFRVNDAGEIAFVDDTTRKSALDHVEQAILLAARHELADPVRAPMPTQPSGDGRQRA